MLDSQKIKEHRGMALLVIPPKNIRPVRFHIALISEYGTLAKGDFMWHLDPADPLLTRQRFPAWGETAAATPGDAVAVLIKPGQTAALTISLATLRSTINMWTEKGIYPAPVTGGQVATWSTYRLNAREIGIKKLQTTVHAPHDGALITWLEKNIRNAKALKPYTGGNLAAMVEVINAHHRFEYYNENQLFAADEALMPGVLRGAAAALNLPAVVVKTWRYEGCIKFGPGKVAGEQEHEENEEEGEEGEGAASEDDKDEDNEDNEDDEDNDDNEDDNEDTEDTEDNEEEEEEPPRATKRSKLGTRLAAATKVGGGDDDDRTPKRKAPGRAGGSGGSAAARPLAAMSPTAARLAKELDAKRARQNAPESREELLQKRLDGAEMVIASKQMQMDSLEAQLKVATDLAENMKKENARLCGVASGLVPSVQQSIMAHFASRTPGELDDLALYDTIPLERRCDALIALTACLGDDMTEQFLIKVLTRAMDVSPLDTRAVTRAVLKVLPDETLARELARAWSVHDHLWVKRTVRTATTEGSPIQKALLAVLG